MSLKLNAATDRRNNPNYEPDCRYPSNRLGVNPPLSCWTYSGPYMSSLSTCEILKDLILAGKVHIDNLGKMVLGSVSDPSPPLYVCREVLRKDQIEDQFARWRGMFQLGPQAQLNLVRT